MNMQILRDLRAITKILILVELKAQPRLKLRDLASKLAITIQAVSEYLKLMAQENLIVKIDGEHRLTQTGVEFLHKSMADLKDFVDSNIKDLNMVDTCVAIARESLKKDDEVGLYMEAGVLMAGKVKRSASRGIILYDAEKGEDVAVVNLSGITRYDYGKLTILELPSALAGGSRAVEPGKVKNLLKKIKPDKLAITDPVGQVVFDKIGVDPEIEFFPVMSALEAAQRGLDVLIFTTTEGLINIISQLDEFNSKTKNKISYSVIPVGKIRK